MSTSTLRSVAAQLARALVAVALIASTMVAHADASQARPGHRKKVAGAALIGVGTAMALAGQILLIHAALFPDSITAAYPPNAPPYGESLNWGEGVPGSVLTALGGAVLLSGIPVYIVGGVEAHRAETPPVALAPQLGQMDSGPRLQLRF
jgi:multisubunit Na+/H+ antiporter MnhB subunit